MDGRKRPSPALVIAVLALFISLSGTAVAAGAPLAKRALSGRQGEAGGQREEARRPDGGGDRREGRADAGPASSTAASCRQAGDDSVAAKNGREFVIACDGGKKVVSGGFASDGDVIQFDSRPMSDTAWGIYLVTSATPAGVTL